MGSSFCVPLVLMLLWATAPSIATAQNSSHSDYLRPHNSARADVGVGPISWNRTLASYARRYAGELAADCQLVHSGGPYGENLFWGGGGGGFAAADAVGLWVAERPHYHYEDNTCDEGQVCGHYTQAVWARSVRVGCARVACDGEGGVIIVCSYYPPGNIIGERPY